LKKKSIFSPENSSESDSSLPAKSTNVKPTSNSVNIQKSQPQQAKIKPTEQKSRPSISNRPSKMILILIKFKRNYVSIIHLKIF
jgi:histone acetyltransferase MYST2